MTEPGPAQRPKLAPRRIVLMAFFSAAIAIAITFWVSNAGLLQANQCKANPLAAQLIDAAAQGELAALNATATGRGYSDMAFTDAAGKPFTVSTFAGKKLLINFWASWCIPCRAEMPALNALAAKYNSDKFMVLPVNLDIGAGGLDKARKFLATGDWPNLPLYADSSFTAFERLKANAVALGLPATLLIDEKGCELGVLQGPAAWDTSDGHKLIEALIAI